MLRDKLKIEQQLAKYGISQASFDIDLTRLRNEGFTDGQAHMLIIRKSSKNTIESVLNKYKTLLAQPYELNRQQIFIIASHDGGSKNIEAVLAAFQSLKDLGFTAKQVVKIAGHGGGSKNIEAVQAAFDALKELGFTAEQVVKIVGQGGGSKNIEAVQAAFRALKELGFTAEQVVKIAGNIGGSKNIEAVQKHYQDLLAMGYSKEALVSMVARDSGSRKVYGIVEKNAAEDAVNNFLHFIYTLQTSASSASRFFTPSATEATKKRPITSETDMNQDKQPKR